MRVTWQTLRAALSGRQNFRCPQSFAVRWHRLQWHGMDKVRRRRVHKNARGKRAQTFYSNGLVLLERNMILLYTMSLNKHDFYGIILLNACEFCICILLINVLRYVSSKLCINEVVKLKSTPRRANAMQCKYFFGGAAVAIKYLLTIK